MLKLQRLPTLYPLPPPAIGIVPDVGRDMDASLSCHLDIIPLLSTGPCHYEMEAAILPDMETAVDPYDMSSFLKGMTIPMDFIKAFRGDLTETPSQVEDTILQGSLSGFMRLPDTIQQEIFGQAWRSWASPSAKWALFHTKGQAKAFGTLLVAPYMFDFYLTIFFLLKDLLLLSRHFYPLLRPLYWRTLQIKINSCFPIRQIGSLLETQPAIRELILRIEIEETVKVEEYEAFQHALGKVLQLCNCRLLSYKWLGQLQIANTYFQTGGRLVSLRIELEGTEFPWGGTTGPAFDYWSELLCALLPQLESLHLSNLEFSANEAGDIVGSIGRVEGAIVQFPDCPRLKELEFGYHHGSSPVPMLQHLLKSAARSLHRISFMDGALELDQLQASFRDVILTNVRVLETRVRSSEPLPTTAFLQTVSTACPTLQVLSLHPYMAKHDFVALLLDHLKSSSWIPNLVQLSMANSDMDAIINLTVEGRKGYILQEAERQRDEVEG